MELINKQLGIVEYTEEQILNFSHGIFGFEELKKYLLTESEYKLIYWLWSVEQPQTVFPLIKLKLIHDTYPDKGEGEAFGIVKLNMDAKKITVNLKAPVYLDMKNKEGFQTIIDTENYPVDYKLFVG